MKEIKWRQFGNRDWLASMGLADMGVHRLYHRRRWRAQVSAESLMRYRESFHWSEVAAKRAAERMAREMLCDIRTAATRTLIEYGQLTPDAAED